MSPLCPVFLQNEHYTSIIPLLLSLCFLALLLGEVALVVEVTEESDEAERVGHDNHVHGVWEVAVSKQVVGGVDCHYKKLELRGRETDRQTDGRMREK